MNWSDLIEGTGVNVGGVVTTDWEYQFYVYFLLNRKRESAGWKQSGLDQL